MMDELKKKYFEHIKSLCGKEFVVSWKDIVELLEDIICDSCPLNPDCEGWCVS